MRENKRYNRAILIHYIKKNVEPRVKLANGKSVLYDEIAYIADSFRTTSLRKNIYGLACKKI